MKRVILVMMLLLSINSIKAQNDPVLAGMILLYTEKAEKTLKNQELAMMMQTTGHLWTKEEVEATELWVMISYLAIYIGIIFLITSAAILALQQLCE